MESIPYEVSGILSTLHLAVRAVLGANLVGLYLRGSLATGGFDARSSDIDFLAVTERRITADEFAKLAALHRRLAALPNRYGARLEGAYLERAAVRRWVPGQHFPTIAYEEALVWREHEANWVLERWAVREQSITITGPDPRTLIDLISADDMRAAVRLRLSDWEAWANQPDDRGWAAPLSEKAYAVETMCRALCTLATGAPPGKPEAVAWALATLSEPWRTIVAQAHAWHYNSASPTPADNEMVRRFILFAAQV